MDYDKLEDAYAKATWGTGAQEPNMMIVSEAGFTRFAKKFGWTDAMIKSFLANAEEAQDEAAGESDGVW